MLGDFRCYIIKDVVCFLCFNGYSYLSTETQCKKSDSFWDYHTEKTKSLLPQQPSIAPSQWPAPTVSHGSGDLGCPLKSTFLWLQPLSDCMRNHKGTSPQLILNSNYYSHIFVDFMHTYYVLYFIFFIAIWGYFILEYPSVLSSL